MKVFECDMCGKIFKPVAEGDVEGRFVLAVGFLTMDDFETRNKTFDVCPRCMSDVENVIEMKKQYRPKTKEENK